MNNINERFRRRVERVNLSDRQRKKLNSIFNDLEIEYKQKSQKTQDPFLKGVRHGMELIQELINHKSSE